MEFQNLGGLIPTIYSLDKIAFSNRLSGADCTVHSIVYVYIFCDLLMLLKSEKFYIVRYLFFTTEYGEWRKIQYLDGMWKRQWKNFSQNIEKL